jgi:hypothetical protein
MEFDSMSLMVQGVVNLDVSRSHPLMLSHNVYFTVRSLFVKATNLFDDSGQVE